MESLQRLPDSTVMNFFMWGLVKEHVYASKLRYNEELKFAIIKKFQVYQWKYARSCAVLLLIQQLF
jgi:hypothetical protein